MRLTSFTLAGVSALALAVTLALSPVFAAPDKKSKDKGKPNVAFNLDVTPLDRSNKTKLTSYADTLDKVTPAVVSIRTAKTVRIIQGGSPFDDIFREFHGLPPRQRNAAPREEKRPTGLGSGTIIHAAGYILTNRHVISDNGGEPAEEITVELSDKRKFTATVVGSDSRTDVAIIKIEGKNLPVAKIADSSALRVGDIVFAVGNPLGVGMSVSTGIISALGREVGILRNENGLESFIQTDASINPGNSGGPLVDAEGRVVGMNTAIASRTGGSVGVGFAVPSSLAMDIISNLVNKGSVSRGYLGVEIQDITPELAEQLNLPAPKGAFVAFVEEKSPADKAGIKPEDTLTAVNGESVESSSSLRYLISRLKPGEKAKVELYRDGKKKTVEVTAGAQKEGDDTLRSLFGQIDFSALTKELRAQYRIPGAIRNGVIVTRNPEDSSTISGRFLCAGAVIIAVNQKQVSTLEELSKAVRKGETNLLRLYVNNSIRVLTLDF